MAVNRVVLVGRMTRDPELRRTASDMAVTSFTIAVDDRPRKDGSTSTSFIPCNVWSKTAENVAQYCHKGSLVAVDGRLQQRSYTAKDGTKRSVIEVVGEQVQFLESKRSSSAETTSAPTPSSVSKADAPVEGIDATDDDIPF
ncbi:MAG TPA: single-stranded DNA-binding protein [Firmicutes bacterium]|nr:single-stranded DNA-binding protein [Bacillota bacterium]